MKPDLDPKTDSDLALKGATGTLSVFHIQAEHHYASLMRHASSVEAGLGGRLLYVRELDEDGRALMIAANIAGAASFAATANLVAQKQAIREGVADFLVTTLDEALRILKNEVRKREAVAVCVAAGPAAVEREMVERGVLPDLARDIGVTGGLDSTASSSGSTALVAPLGPAQSECLLTWSVDATPAQWLPKLDAMAMECLALDDSRSAQVGRRWLRQAPRYMGRITRNVRVLRCSTTTAETIAERMRAGVKAGEIPVTVRIEIV